MSWCKRCDDYSFKAECDCMPWEVAEADVSYKGEILGYSDPVVLYARDPEKAAERFMEKVFTDSACESTSCLVKIDGDLYDCEAEPTVDFVANKRRQKTLMPESKVGGE